MLFRSMAAAAFAACCLASSANAQSQHVPATNAQDGSAVSDDIRLRWLDQATFAPDAMFAKPPARGSIVEQTDLARLRTIIARASAERLLQAKWDGDHEDPAAFSAAAGRDLARLPATAALLAIISDEVERIVVRAKRHFARPRPYQVDPELPHCGKGSPELLGYPSGHAGYGWSVGWTLAKLMPARAPALLERAQDYSYSRQLCGSHFSFDLEASHAMALIAVEKLLADPRLATQVAAARAELNP